MTRFVRCKFRNLKFPPFKFSHGRAEYKQLLGLKGSNHATLTQ